MVGRESGGLIELVPASSRIAAAGYIMRPCVLSIKVGPKQRSC